MTMMERLIRAEWLSGRFVACGQIGLGDLMERCARIFEAEVFAFAEAERAS